MNNFELNNLCDDKLIICNVDGIKYKDIYQLKASNIKDFLNFSLNYKKDLDIYILDDYTVIAMDKLKNIYVGKLFGNNNIIMFYFNRFSNSIKLYSGTLDKKYRNISCYDNKISVDKIPTMIQELSNIDVSAIEKNYTKDNYFIEEYDLPPLNKRLKQISLSKTDAIIIKTLNSLTSLFDKKLTRIR